MVILVQIALLPLQVQPERGGASLFDATDFQRPDPKRHFPWHPAALAGQLPSTNTVAQWPFNPTEIRVKNKLCERLGIEYPIFAFTHCRDVVVAVSKAGGIGVLGAVGFSPAQLKEELDWIDAHIGDKPYGVDIVIPQKYEGMGDMTAEEMEAQLWKMVPKEHMDFAQKLLADAGVPPWPDGTKSMGLMGWTDAPIYAADQLIDEVGQLPEPEPGEQADEIIDEFKDFIDNVSPEDFAS